MRITLLLSALLLLTFSCSFTKVLCKIAMHSLNALGLIICTTGFFFTFCWFCNINGPQEILSSSDGASSKKNLFSSYPLCIDILLASMHSRHLTPASSPIGCRLTQIGIEFLPILHFLRHNLWDGKNNLASLFPPISLGNPGGQKQKLLWTMENVVFCHG